MSRKKAQYICIHNKQKELSQNYTAAKKSMKIKVPLLLFLLIFSQLGSAQFVKERSVDIAIGYGLSAPYDNVDVVGTGFTCRANTCLAWPPGWNYGPMRD
ncbi:hypothetical protein [Muriicola sp.]|uniref:hypothetical protein n=1 Tax=Muriicola sp. TaxID=2020856 RepID=UPI003C738411